MRPQLRANGYEDEIATAEGCLGPLLPFMFAEDTRTREQLLDELKDLTKIRKWSQKCAKKNYSEPAWNEAVHFPILNLALESFAGVEYENVYGRRRSLILSLIQRLMLSSTTARIVPSLVPLQSKIVDYTINLQPNDEMEGMILRLLEKQPSGLRTINQTMCDHVRYLPIAISMETKTPDASAQEAKIQLGMWVAAHFNRLRTLSHENVVLPTLPLLYVSGKWWYLFFACDRAQHIVCSSSTYLVCQVLTFWQELLGELLIGDTNSVEGCYKLLAALRCLAGWVTTTFKEWLELKVLQPNAV
jgi:hypothetical protein